MLGEMGTDLDEEQLETALKDLDLNGDGVIDFSEFQRWHFSGMKQYSEKRRTILQAH